jgi:chromosome partitioning protein
MHKIIVCCQKGGIGKTTLALNLLVEGVKRGLSPALFDADDQGTLALLSDQRKRLHGQALPLVSSIPSSGLVIIDTAPHANAALPPLLKDGLAIIPVRPAVPDLVGAQTTIEVARRHARTVAVVFNFADRRRQGTLASAVQWLTKQKGPLIGYVHQAAAVETSMGEGLGMCEAHPSHDASKEFETIADFAYDAMK